MILANAHPKCGTNLAKKVLGGLGLKHEVGGLIRYKPFGAMYAAKGFKWESLDKDRTHFLHGHFCFGSVPADMGLVCIHRHPRNALISFMRWSEEREGNPFALNRETALTLMLKGPYVQGFPWAQSVMAHAPWLNTENVCNVRFEEICSDGGKSVARIAHYVKADMSKVDEVYEGLYGNGSEIKGRPVYDGPSTWTGEWSSWEDFWTDEYENVWKETGGLEAEVALGYGS